jgi:hypothetical protein
MFIEIIIENLRYVRKQTHKTENFYPGFFSFIIRDLIKRRGLKRLTEEDLQAKYKNPVEQSPEKVDELFLALHTVIISLCVSY